VSGKQLARQAKYQPAPGCPPAGAEPAGEDRLPLPSAGGSTGHLVHDGPALRLAAELEHVPRVGLRPHDHVDLRARGGAGGRRRTRRGLPHVNPAVPGDDGLPGRGARHVDGDAHPAQRAGGAHAAGGPRRARVHGHDQLGGGARREPPHGVGVEAEHDGVGVRRGGARGGREREQRGAGERGGVVLEGERAEAGRVGRVHPGAGAGARHGGELEEELVHGDAHERAGVHGDWRASERPVIASSASSTAALALAANEIKCAAASAPSRVICSRGRGRARPVLGWVGLGGKASNWWFWLGMVCGDLFWWTRLDAGRTRMCSRGLATWLVP
jgi:hypothetical protein